MTWGQEQFQLLLQESQTSEACSGVAEDVCLEELRYRWMLHKSKLKDVTDARARARSKVREQSYMPINRKLCYSLAWINACIWRSSMIVPRSMI